MSETLQHTRSCPALTPGNDEECTCGLRWRIELQTEREMHNAWRKRAEEAEAAAPPADETLAMPNEKRKESLWKIWRKGGHNFDWLYHKAFADGLAARPIGAQEGAWIKLHTKSRNKIGTTTATGMRNLLGEYRDAVVENGCTLQRKFWSTK